MHDETSKCLKEPIDIIKANDTNKIQINYP